MNFLRIITLLSTCALAEVSASQPISKFRLIKEYIAGNKDRTYGKYYQLFPNGYLSANSNYERHFTNPRWWSQEIARREMFPGCRKTRPCQ